MKSRKIMRGIARFSLLSTAVIVRQLPDRIPVHYDAAGNIDRWGSRYESLVFPVIIVLLALFWTRFIRYFEKKAAGAVDEKTGAAALSNAKVFGITGVRTTAMFTVMQAFVLYGAYSGAVSGADSWTVDIGKVSAILMGILIIVLGNYMTKSRMNSVIGFRTGCSMYNDNTWRESNRFASRALMAAGALTVITALLVKNSLASTLAMLVYLGVATGVSLVKSHGIYLREKESAERDEER